MGAYFPVRTLKRSFDLPKKIVQNKFQCLEIRRRDRAHMSTGVLPSRSFLPQPPAPAARSEKNCGAKNENEQQLENPRAKRRNGGGKARRFDALGGGVREGLPDLIDRIHRRRDIPAEPVQRQLVRLVQAGGGVAVGVEDELDGSVDAVLGGDRRLVPARIRGRNVSENNGSAGPEILASRCRQNTCSRGRSVRRARAGARTGRCCAADTRRRR